MKSIKISENTHRKLKDLTAPGGLTFNDIVEKLLVSVPNTGVPYTGVPRGGNASQDSNTTGYRTPVHQNTVHQNTVHQDTVHQDTKKVEEKENQKLLNDDSDNGKQKENQPVFVALPPNNEKNKVAAVPKNKENKEKEKKKMGELSKEDILRIVADGIREAKNQDQEKAKQEKSLEDLKTTLSKGLKDLEGKFCTPDGKACFVTPGELQSYLAKQKQEFGESISQKLTEIAKAKEEQPKEQKKEAVLGVQPLPKITKEIRAGMSEAEEKGRDAKIADLMTRANLSYVDIFRQLKNSPEDCQTIKRKALADTDLKEKLNACELGNPEACKKLFEASKLVVLKENQKNKKWEAVYNPEEEEKKPEVGLFGLPRK